MVSVVECAQAEASSLNRQVTNMIRSRILIAGAGSIGRKHLANLHGMNIGDLAVCDPDKERAYAGAGQELPVFTDFHGALEQFQPSAVFVCSPPIFHVEQTLAAIHSGADVFMEKPVSNSMDKVHDLIAAAEACGRVVQVGYNLRFDPGVRRLKDIVERETIGRVLWARAEVGHYLPNWRPWQDYRLSYTGRKELGGGVILDLSHEMDYLTWILGDPIQILCMSAHTGTLAVDVEDSASILLRFRSGAHADLHMDCLQRSRTRICKLVGEKGTAQWDAVTSELRVWVDGKEHVASCASDPNDSYVAEVRHFLECVERRSTPLVDLKHAIRVLELCLIAQASSEPVAVEDS